MLLWSIGRDCRIFASCSAGEPLTRRLTVLATLFANARGHLSRLVRSHCASATLLAERIGLGADV